MASRIHVRTVLLFYLAMLGAALLWGALRGDVNVFVLPREGGEPRPELPIRVALGVGGGLFGVLLARVLSRASWARRLNEEFRKWFGTITLFQVTVFAVTSAVAEEA